VASWKHCGHYKRGYPKLSALCDAKSHLVLGAVVDRGPRPDVVEFPRLIKAALSRHRFRAVVGDAGYESERAHVFCREEQGVRSVFPTTVRGRKRKDGRPRRLRSRWRRKLARRFPRKLYRMRAQIEAAFSMMKRNLGSALRARKPFAVNREVILKVITHNLAILKRAQIVCRQHL
jgi:hypothetical protein